MCGAAGNMTNTDGNRLTKYSAVSVFFMASRDEARLTTRENTAILI